MGFSLHRTIHAQRQEISDEEISDEVLHVFYRFSKVLKIARTTPGQH